jgi:hypothetical protein
MARGRVARDLISSRPGIESGPMLTPEKHFLDVAARKWNIGAPDMRLHAL